MYGRRHAIKIVLIDALSWRCDLEWMCNQSATIPSRLLPICDDPQQRAIRTLSKSHATIIYATVWPSCYHALLKCWLLPSRRMLRTCFDRLCHMLSSICCPHAINKLSMRYEKAMALVGSFNLICVDSDFTLLCLPWSNLARHGLAWLDFAWLCSA